MERSRWAWLWRRARTREDYYVNAGAVAVALIAIVLLDGWTELIVGMGLYLMIRGAHNEWRFRQSRNLEPSGD